MPVKAIYLDQWEAEQLQDPKLCKIYEDLEPAYQVAHLRIARGVTQQELAELIVITQSNIARLQSGKGVSVIVLRSRRGKGVR